MKALLLTDKKYLFKLYYLNKFLFFNRLSRLNQFKREKHCFDNKIQNFIEIKNHTKANQR